MEKSKLPLNEWQSMKTQRAINCLHSFIHGASLSALFYYRITSISKTNSPILPHLLIFTAELTLSCIWLLSQASLWNPVTRTAYPERLPGDDHLPSVDVFVCTADPAKEPSLEVMNTVISAMALDYPPDKLHLYLSDDGGSPVMLRALRRAREFAKVWIPFCRKYRVKERCPGVYFMREESGGVGGGSDGHFFVEKNATEKAYEDFKNSLDKIIAEADVKASRDHSPTIEVINDGNSNGTDSSNDDGIPPVVYVAREKRPSHSHNFKAGALNVLLRVSGMISNSPYILSLDCDMYCNDPTSARQAMCFHLDTKLSQNLAFVQFPQIFHNIRRNHDIYDGALRFIWTKWDGLNGLNGPGLTGTAFYVKREALYGIRKLQPNATPNQLKEYYGSSNDFIKSISKIYRPNQPTNALLTDVALQKEVQLLASCSYDIGTKWGKEVGYRYFAVVEDYFTGFNLHCEGWASVYLNPSRPCFLGSSPMSLGDTLVQNTRWFLGLSQVALSKYSPLVYGALRMSLLQSMVYAELAYYAIYFLPVYILAPVPQLCLLAGIPLYPEVSSPFFAVFVFIFVSSQLKHAQEVMASGDSLTTWVNEQRAWAMKSLTSYFLASVNAILEKIGLTKASFVPTSKIMDNEVAKLYQQGKFDFQAPSLFMVILCTLYMLNLTSFVVGFGRILQNGRMNEMVMQAFLPLFGVVLHYPLMEGMVLRKDVGRVSPLVSILSTVISSLISAYAALIAR